MARLYADENFHYSVVVELRNLGHDVLTVQEAGLAGQGIPDPQVLAFATNLGRAVLTYNRKNFIKLHKNTTSHSGIVVCTDDRNYLAVAQKIHQKVNVNAPLDNKLIRVTKP